MNEVIRALATTAGLRPFEFCGEVHAERMKNLEKFAELIVNEALVTLEHRPVGSNPGKFVREHFGIEK